jgi:hypothetical protein
VYGRGGENWQRRTEREVRSYGIVKETTAQSRGIIAVYEASATATTRGTTRHG